MSGDPRTEEGISSPGMGELEEHPRIRSNALHALEEAIDGMAILDDDGRFVFVNEAHAEVYGYDDPEDLVDDHWSILYDEPELERIEEEIMPQLERQGSWRGRARGLRADGSTFLQELSLSALNDGGMVCVVRDVSEREERYEALVRYRANLELAEERAGLGHWVWWPDSGEVEWSDGLYRIAGRDPDRYEPTPWSLVEIAHPDDRETVRDAIDRAARDPQRFDFDCRIRLPCGDRREISVAGRVQTDPMANPQRVLGTVVDVTEMREQERGRLEVQERLETVLEGTRTMAFEIRGEPGDWDVLYASAAMRDVVGIEPEQMLEGLSVWRENVHPADLDRVEAALARVHTERTPEEVTYRYRSPDEDGWIWIRVRMVPRSREGQGASVLGIGWEVTDEIHRERKLEHQRENLELAEEVADLGHWTWDLGTGEIRWSEGCYEVHGKDPDGFQPSFDAFLDTVHPDDAPLVEQTIARAVEEGTSWSVDYRVPIEGDRTRVVAAHGRIQADEQGEGTMAFGTVQDITDRHEEQERLKTYNEDLLRTHEDLGRFAYVAAHDLKEPLRNVASYVQLLERRYADELDDDAREYIGYAVEGAQRMRRLLNEMLAYTEVASKEVKLERVDLEEPVERARENLSNTIDAEGAKVTSNVHHEAEADPDQITQVLQNLIENGIKFNEAETPQVHVESEQVGERVVVSVQDDGIGILEAYQDQLFQLFKRLHGRDEYGGTGLGLGICRQIVRRHGGEIWVHSEEDLGSTFCFTLPAPEEAPGAEGDRILTT